MDLAKSLDLHALESLWPLAAICLWDRDRGEMTVGHGGKMTR